ncbi:MAG: hypothetical protein V1656_03180 [Candidatus Jorgensenbacteria bacterium]
MKKYIAIFIAVAFVCSIAGARTVAAATPSPVEKAIEGVKDKLDALVNAKDEQSPDELAFRVSTMKKVIEFSVAEANDLKIKLLAVEMGKEAESWRDATVKKLNDALAHYADVKGNLEDKESTIDLAGVKAMAQEFKDWRTTYLIATADAVRDFLLISQEGSAIETAKKRAQKIGEDVTKLKNAKYKVAKDLAILLNKANNLVGEGAKLNETAHARFWNEFIIPAMPKASSTESSATSTEPEAQATSSVPEIQATSFTPEAQATSSAPISSPFASSTNNQATSTLEATSTAAAAALPPSIRDLVKSSLTKVREAYQVFIEMSALVRKAP